ncbi:hypothetical protein [Nocardia aurea]|uniref:hypothetical protein n=1 Tax=Nocardia aurea TaxID=2144174 RepID=UPI0033AD1808
MSALPAWLREGVKRHPAYRQIVRASLAEAQQEVLRLRALRDSGDDIHPLDVEAAELRACEIHAVLRD